MVEQVLGLLATLKAGWEKAWHAAVSLWHEVARAVPPLGPEGPVVSALARENPATQ